MVMISICDLFAKKDKGLEILKEFELISLDEINDLVEPDEEDEKYFTPNGGAMMKWWIPLNRASRIVQEEMLPGGHIPKEGKQIVSGLTKIFDDLDTVADYSQRHLPAFVMEAVKLIFWVSMI